MCQPLKALNSMKQVYFSSECLVRQRIKLKLSQVQENESLTNAGTEPDNTSNSF